MTIREQLNTIAVRRILILDGAMGSLIQARRLREADFRGSRFASHGKSLAGCNDLLCLTKPEVISSIHEEYLKAGADIIETCSFNATALSLEDYGIGELAYEISTASAVLARRAADAFSTPDKPRFVAGSMGPTAKSASISPDINDPVKRSVTWDTLTTVYYDNARGLLDGGADILLIETIFDTLNAKAAIFAISRLREERKIDIPVMISATVSGTAGRLLTGQTVEDFCISVLHANPWAIGLNCSSGAELLKPHIKKLAGFVPCPVSAYPNAGMPDQLGNYGETPEAMASVVAEYIREGLVNIVGGCCGSTPAHIAAIAARALGAAPRSVPLKKPVSVFSGLKTVPLDPEGGISIMDEKALAGENRKLGALIKEGDYDGAVEFARETAEKSVPILDIKLDENQPDPETALIRFINLALAYPELSRLPFMIRSSRWRVIEAGLKSLPGKGIVHAISLRDGEEEFLRRARLIRRYGAAVVVNLIDEQGREKTAPGNVEIARRAHALLTGDNFPPEDILYDAEGI